MLADGSPISTDSYDEYSPTLMTRDDGYLVLIFASDRSCGGCSAGYHNLFVSVSVAPYYDGLILPAFNTPVVVRPDGASPADSTSRLEFIAEASGPNVIVAYKNLSNLYLFQLDATGQSNGAGISHAPAGNSTRAADTLLGFGPEPGTMLTRDGTNVVRYSSITAVHNGRQTTNAAFITAGTVARINPLYTGFNGAIFSADSGYLTMGTLYTDFGFHADFQDALDEEGILLTTVQIFDAGSSADDLLLFSAHDGISEDLYAVNSHTVGELWALAEIYGDYSDSSELRNQWTVLPVTLPATRTGMAAGTVGSKGYLIAGFNGSTANTIYEFDFVSETFTNCGNGPGSPCTATWSANLYGASTAVVGNLIYVLGGTPTGSTTAATNTFGYFDASNYTVTPGQPVYPLNRMAPAMVVSGNQIFAMGGSSNATDCAGTNYNCTNNYAYTLGGSWSAALANIPYGCTNGASVAYAGSIFLFGGSTDGTNGIASISEYSIAGNSWPNCGSTCGNLAQTRFDLQAVTFGNKVYIMGGMHGGAYTTYNLVEEFDMDAGTLTNCDGGCATMPAAIANGSALLYGNSIYYFGGRTNLSNYVNTVYKYTP